jgi:hypothetical protein
VGVATLVLSYDRQSLCMFEMRGRESGFTSMEEGPREMGVL